MIPRRFSNGGFLWRSGGTSASKKKEMRFMKKFLTLGFVALAAVAFSTGCQKKETTSTTETTTQTEAPAVVVETGTAASTATATSETTTTTTTTGTAPAAPTPAK
jgi:hypothetical protein